MHIKEYMRGEGGTVVMSDGMEVDKPSQKRTISCESEGVF